MSALDGVQASSRELTELLSVAVRAAEAAANVIREGARTVRTLEWRTKSAADFVSDVDTAAEEAIRSVVERSVPGAVVVGEELSPDAAAGTGVAFIVDPLDGTTNFLHGYPEYAVSIAIMIDGRLAAGTVLNVPTGELATATAGGGAYLGAVPLRVSSMENPERALIGTGFPFKHTHLLPTYLPQLAHIIRSTSGVRRAGSAALDLVDVAAGRFDGFWELVLSPWDFAAGIVIVREAGGVVTDLDGREPQLTMTGIVAGNPAIHRWLLQVVAEHDAGA